MNDRSLEGNRKTWSEARSGSTLLDQECDRPNPLVRQSITKLTTSNRVADQVRSMQHSLPNGVPSTEGIL